MEKFDFSFKDENDKKAFVAFCEAKFRSTLDRVVEEICVKKDIKFITLSGPTCSGKTTTANILIEKLKENGKHITAISLDDFFLDRDVLVARAKESGMPFDMDSAAAIDINCLAEFIAAISEGKTAYLPRFNFTTGNRSGMDEVIPDHKSVYIFEGIQGVYPEVTSIFDSNTMMSIYISISEELEANGIVWQPRELRFLRRLLRDSLFRNTSALTTFEHWDGVKYNEIKNIEPYKDNCDITINSEMPYEICVLKAPVMRLLEGIPKESPFSDSAVQIYKRLAPLPEISALYVPADSVCREFIGN